MGPSPPQHLSQSILPGWGAFNMTVNYQGSPDIETEVVRDVASFGRQIGWLSELVLELCKIQRRRVRPRMRSSSCGKRRKRIKAIKDAGKRAPASRPPRRWERFRKEHPQRYALFLRDKAAELQAAESKGEAV